MRNLFFRNSEGYFDPTAGLALAHIQKEERDKQRKAEERHKREAQRVQRLKVQLLKMVEQYRKNRTPFDQALLRKWVEPVKYKSKAEAWREATIKEMNVQITTLGTSQEYDPWQELANAIILRAVNDYRGYTQKMNTINEQLKSDHLPDKKREQLLHRYQRYEELQDDLGDFFFSELFSKITKIDGYDLLDELNQEVEH